MLDGEIEIEERNTNQKPPDIRERTYGFALRVVRLCRKAEADDQPSRRLIDQLVRSGTSIGANVEEAWGAVSNRDFLNKIAIARKEARETRYWLRLLADAEIIKPARLADLTDEAHQFIAILTTMKKNAEAKK